MINGIDRDMTRRVFLSLYAHLYSHLRTIKSYPYNYVEMNNLLVSIRTLVDVLNGHEQAFLEWATKSANDDYWYGDAQSGLSRGKAIPQCYSNVYNNMDKYINNPEVFNYLLDEYLIMERAKVSAQNIEERESRTCDKCQTRFDTQDGMHRHQSRCNGLYRGDYHAKPKMDKGWNGGKTSSW
jgi:hypothetical protein